ncbi:UNVERIFIED_CONTAM: hypothetical protein HDU68_002542 [Siphonaria sp. JEL0065]|nr:hypothetical protein HDU68_002542 [Siphonaria sp. JEL0065]
MPKTIIFDLGGVILNLDYNAAANAFETAFDIKNFSGRMFSQGSQRTEMDAFERGQALQTPALFCDFLRNCSAFDPEERQRLALATEDQIVEAWNSMLFDIPQSRVDYVKSLRDRGYKVYLLSNINIVHESYVDQIIERDVQGGITFWKSCFDRIFYSHHIARRKPDPETFEWVLKEIGCSAAPGDVMFFDDSKQHVDGAASVGIKSVLVPREHGLIEVVEPFL